MERVDLGSLRIPTLPNREVRLQVEEQSGAVQAVLILGPDGALEVRAFAAPRATTACGSEARPEIADDDPATAAPPPSARAAGAPS